jgi:hypothetical protein
MKNEGPRFTQLRSTDARTPRSLAACAYETPRCVIRLTASSLNSRVNFRLSMTHLRFHQDTYLGVHEIGSRPHWVGQSRTVSCNYSMVYIGVEFQPTAGRVSLGTQAISSRCEDATGVQHPLHRIKQVLVLWNSLHESMHVANVRPVLLISRAHG